MCFSRIPNNNQRESTGLQGSTTERANTSAHTAVLFSYRYSNVHSSLGPIYGHSLRNRVNLHRCRLGRPTPRRTARSSLY